MVSGSKFYRQIAVDIVREQKVDTRPSEGSATIIEVRFAVPRNAEGSAIRKGSKPALGLACELLGAVTPEMLERALCFKSISVGGAGAAVYRGYSVGKAEDARNDLTRQVTEADHCKHWVRGSKNRR